ncbi:MAG: AAA family ATPase, partial [Pseudomonadota bacterium]
MRIARLSLEFFGRFTDHSFDFGLADGPSDFHVIYGPNEAGKTTTMEGFLRLLYGFPTREPYDFQHQRKNLKVSGVLELDGAQRSFTRLPTRAGTLLDGSGATVPEQALSAHLGGLAIEDYRSLLCLDDDTIEKGGEDIANARGDIGRLLFSAAAGISDLSTVLDAARAEADMLYRKRASSTRMALLKKDLAEVERSIREKDVTAGAWQKRKDAVRQAEGAEREAREARDALRNRAAWVEAQRRVLPDLHEHEDLSAEIAPFAAYPDRLDLNPEDLVALTAAQGKAEADIARLTAAIADAEAARDAIVFDEDGPALAEALDGLDTLRSRMRTADLDLPKRRQTAREARDDMARVARDLGAPDTADPAHLVVAPAEIARLEQLLEETRTADLARETEAAEVAELEARLRAATDASATLRDETPAPTGLRDLLVHFEADALAPDVARAQDALDAAKTHFEEALDALSTEEQSWTELPARPLSPHEAAELAAEHTKLAAQIASAQEKLADYEDEIRVKAALRAGMAEAEGVIGDAEARQAREERD